MFASKLFFVLALLLVGQQALASPTDYFHLKTEFANSGNVSQVRPSTTNPDASPSPCVPHQSYFDYLDEVNPNAKRDHLNYMLMNDNNTFVGMGPLNRPIQHLEIVAIIAHLKAADKEVYFPGSTAQYETLADSLIAGGRIKLISLHKPLVSADEAFFTTAFLFRMLAKWKMCPNLNYYIPAPYLEQITTPKQFLMSYSDVQNKVLERMDSEFREFFDLEMVKELAADAIIEFEESEFNDPEFVNAKDVEKWVLRGTGQESIEIIM